MCSNCVMGVLNGDGLLLWRPSTCIKAVVHGCNSCVLPGGDILQRSTYLSDSDIFLPEEKKKLFSCFLGLRRGPL